MFDESALHEELSSGRCAAVTGAAQGIGRAIAIQLSSDGFGVAIGDIRETEARALARELGGPAFAASLDVRDEASVRRFIKRVVDRFSGLDLLVCNAGVEIDGPVDELAREEWDDVIATSLTGTYLCCRYALPHLRKRHGAIVAVGSVLGRASQPGTTAYSAAKAGLEALVRTMAVDHAREGVRVNCVLPGTVNTRLVTGKRSGKDLHSFLKAAGDSIPIGRVGEPSEIAKAVSFLGSGDASYITGSSLVVDGGLVARLSTDF